MAKITVKEITDKKTWEDFALKRAEGNFLQSYNWGLFHQNIGKAIKRIGFYKENKLVGIIQCIIEKAKRATYLTIGGGPLIDWEKPEILQLFKQTVIDIAKKYNCSFIRVRPQIFENGQNSKIFEKLGFKKAPMHLHAELTHQLNLTKSEDELLASLRKTTRYEIKQAIKLGIKITASKNVKDMGDFYNLQKETAKRQGFVEFDKKFLMEQFRVFSKDNQVLLYTAYFKNIKLAQAFIIFYNLEADYHYGASTPEGRNYPGAHLIQWEAIREAKKQGIKRYNLWGVAPLGDINHRFFGVSVFKRGFGGEDIEYLHARDFIINPIIYKINQAVELARKKLRRL